VRVAVLTISDRASRGEYEDRSGPELVAALRRAIEASQGSARGLSDLSVETRIVPDEEAQILQAFQDFGAVDWIITTGGTGPSPRDRTPEATRRWIDRELPGIAEALRALSLAETVNAVFSRGLAGMRGNQFVVNLPGSVNAVRSGAAFLARIMEHGVAMAGGGGH